MALREFKIVEHEAEDTSAMREETLRRNDKDDTVAVGNKRKVVGETSEARFLAKPLPLPNKTKLIGQAKPKGFGSG